MEFVHGVDVSDYQPGVSWAAVKASGYSFAIAKATQGVGNIQSTFAGNLSGIRAVGMIAGAYHFLDWNQDPVAQAKHFLSVYTPRAGDLPPTLDCEACTVDSAAAIAQVSGFIHEIEPHLNGARILLYMSYSFPQDSLEGGSGFSGHPLWVAAYNDAAEPPVPDAWTKATIWQWSDAGKVGGIEGSVDLDKFVGTLDELKAFALK
jgi:lysozyme